MRRLFLAVPYSVFVSTLDEPIARPVEVFLYLRQQRPVHPWQAVVIYPSWAVDPGEPPHYAALLQSEQVVRVYLDEWARTALLSRGAQQKDKAISTTGRGPA